MDASSSLISTLTWKFWIISCLLISIFAVLFLPSGQQGLGRPLHAVIGASLQESVDDLYHICHLQLLCCDGNLVKITKESQDIPVIPLCAGSLHLQNRMLNVHGSWREMGT